MEFKLPKLKTDVDCEPIGYPGLVFQFWLNPTLLEKEWEAPEDPQPWDRWWYVAYARVCLKITFPADLTEGGEEEVVEDVTAKVLYDLEKETPGFESAVVSWAWRTWDKERTERLEVAVKN